MNQYQQALDELLFCKHNSLTCAKCNHKERCTIERDSKTIQELIDKETPMKVIDHRNQLGGQTFCSKCLVTIFDSDDEPSYCSNCGQALKWSEENEK